METSPEGNNDLRGAGLDHWAGTANRQAHPRSDFAKPAPWLDDLVALAASGPDGRADAIAGMVEKLRLENDPDSLAVDSGQAEPYLAETREAGIGRWLDQQVEDAGLGNRPPEDALKWLAPGTGTQVTSDGARTAPAVTQHGAARDRGGMRSQ
ncbi:hypothetical protein [Kribbella sp. NPDC055071]